MFSIGRRMVSNITDPCVVLSPRAPLYTLSSHTEELSLESIFSSFPDEPIFRLLAKDCVLLFSCLRGMENIRQKVMAQLQAVISGGISPWKAHEFIAELRLIYDVTPDAIQHLDGDQFFVQVEEVVHKILQDAKKEYLRILTSTVYQRIYGKTGFKICLLPLTVARCLFCHDGTLNLGLVSRLKEVFLPQKSKRDDIEVELVDGLKRCVEDHTISSAIESLNIPVSALGERIVRTTLSLDVQEPVSSYHLRIVCCSSFLTWIRQFGERDCYAKALLLQIQQGSFQQFFDDFRHLTIHGALFRSLSGKEASFIPLEELPSIALGSKVLCRDVRFLLKIPAVKNAFSIMHADESRIRMAVQKVKDSDQSCTLKKVFEELASDRQAFCYARMYFEAPVQNITHQVLENGLVNLFVRPEPLVSPFPEEGEKIEWVWHQVIHTFLEKTFPQQAAEVKVRCKAVLSEKIRLAFSPQKDERGDYPLWRICSHNGSTQVPIESKQDLGKLLHEILKEELVKDETVDLCTSLVLGIRFFTVLQRHIQRLRREPGSEVHLQENPICFPSSGHYCEALVRRCFPELTIPDTVIPFDGKEFVRWAVECQEKYGALSSLSFCTAVGSHAFRLFPFVPAGVDSRDVQAIVQPFIESSVSLCRQPWSLLQESPVVKQLVEYWMSSLKSEEPSEDIKGKADRSVEGVLSEFSLLSSRGKMDKEKVLLLMLSLLKPLEQFSQFHCIEKIITTIAKSQAKHSKLKGEARDFSLCSSCDGSARLVTAIGKACMKLILPLPQKEIHQLACAIEKMVRDALFQEGISGNGLFLRIGDSNYLTNVMGVVRRGETFLWYNPFTKKWNQVVYFAAEAWDVKEQEKIRIIELAPTLVRGVKNQSELHEARQKRKAEQTKEGVTTNS